MASAIEAALAVKERLDQERGKNFYEWKERQTIRIAPPWGDSGVWFQEFGKHFIPSPEGKKVVYCNNKTFGEECLVCRQLKPLWDQFRKTGDKTLEKSLRQLSASKRFYINIIASHELEKGIQIAEVPVSIWEKLVATMADKEAGYGDITDPLSGRDIIVTKTGKGIETEWNVTIKPDRSAVKEEFLKSIPDLSAIVTRTSYADLSGIFSLPAPPEALPAPDDPPPFDVEMPDFAAPPSAAPAASVSTTPVCFGQFNELNSKCLDCSECDDCEAKLTADSVERATPPAAVLPAASARTPVPLPVPPLAAAASTGDVDFGTLMAEMAKAIGK